MLYKSFMQGKKKKSTDKLNYSSYVMVEVSFYLSDKSLLDNCRGCQHVGNKGAALRDAE